MPAVEVDSLVRRFGPVTAVDGATFACEAGAVTCVLGPNGAGKTTTIECLEGLQRPDGGRVRVLGADPWRADADHRARVGVMLQDGGLPQSVRPIVLLRHIASLHAGRTRGDELVERLGIGGFAGTSIRRLSGGQRQRVALAAALVADPEVAFLDEPSAGLDPYARRDVWDLVRAAADRGCAAVVTTHSFEEAARLADRVVIIAAGRVVADGTVGQLAPDGDLEAAFFETTRTARR